MTGGTTPLLSRVLRAAATAVAAVLAASLILPSPAFGLALRVPPLTRLVADVGLDVRATDPGGLGLLYADGRLIATMPVIASVPTTFAAVSLPQGEHDLRALVRSRTGIAVTPSVHVSSWGTPEAPRLTTPVHEGLYPKAATFPVYVAVGANRLTVLVDGVQAWTKAVLAPATVPVGLTLASGVHKVDMRAENPLDSRSTSFSLTRPTWPVPSSHDVGSRFGMRDGRMHKGIDIHADYGAPVVAAAAGTVIWAKPLTTYGGLVMIDHGGRMATYYAHLSSIGVKLGQKVSVGQQIGRVGVANVAHLHFQLFADADNGNPDPNRRVNSGTPVDPYPYVVP